MEDSKPLRNLRLLQSSARSRIADRDKAHLDPVERAELIHEFLFRALRLEDERDSVTNPLFWDLLCYFSQLFNVYAIQTNEEIGLELAKELNQYLLSHHYSVPDGHAVLGPEREIHLGIWKDRIELITEVE